MTICACGARWSGAKVSHCAVCHATFSTVGLFDRHRTGPWDQRGCLDPAGLKRVGSRRNVYGTTVWLREPLGDLSEAW